MKRIIISLFDRQKDYGAINKGKRGRAKPVRPSVAIAEQRDTQNSNRYILLHEPRYAKEAESIKAEILQAMQNNRCRKPAKVVPDADGGVDISPDEIVAEEPPIVTLLPVDYGEGGVWDIATTTKAIKEALSELGAAMRKIDFRVYVNLVNGTAEQRTALALWAHQTTRSRQAMKPEVVKTEQIDGKTKEWQDAPASSSCVFARQPQPGGKWEFTNADSAFGFLQCKFNTLNPPLRQTLENLEQLLKRVRIGLEDILLLTGPSGAGKTMVAKMCMKLLQCLHPEIKNEQCVHLNMAAIPENLFESELFGHVKGAFTGANDDKTGIVELANGGILFLDEIGELPLHLQAKLLTFLDSGSYRKVGGTEVEHSNFLLICGTNRELESDIPRRFRRDLYERINMWHFTIPGLRERPEDLEPALRRELAIWNDREKAGLQFAPKAKQQLLEHLRTLPLEGNYREFHSIVRRLATLAQGSIITEDNVRREIGTLSFPGAESTQPPLDQDLVDLARLSVALTACKSAKNAREAGELLFAASKARADANGTVFNGSAYFQRLFAQFGLKVKFKDGKFDTIERLH